ncbi:MAG: nitroreductase family protein [Rubrivivax sp.]
MPDPELPLLDALLTRRSIGPRGLDAPAPSPEALQAAAELALCAPDHQGLRPFRFVHVGEDMRDALGACFARGAAEQGRDADGTDAARARAAVGPALLAVVVRIRDDVPDVPPHEQWLCVGAGVMNLLNALHLMGYGAKVLGGSLARTDAVRQAFCSAGEEIACWVIAGTPRGEAADHPPRRARDLLTDWSPS